MKLNNVERAAPLVTLLKKINNAKSGLNMGRRQGKNTDEDPPTLCVSDVEVQLTDTQAARMLDLLQNEVMDELKKLGVEL